MAKVEITYSPTQIKILDVLGDGQYHTKKELQTRCCGEDRYRSNTLATHLTLLRKKLLRESANGTKLNIVPIYEAEEVTYQLVKVTPATIKDVKSLRKRFTPP